MLDIQRLITTVVIAALILGLITLARLYVVSSARALRRKQQLPEEEPQHLTKEDLLTALREERQLAKRDARAQLVINIVITVFSIVAGWLLSGLVHLPGQH